MEGIAREEKIHYDFFKELTQLDVAPHYLKARFYFLLAKVLGLNFALKSMERAEELTQNTYAQIKEIAPQIDTFLKNEKEHEKKLISLIDEERLKYISSVVLGLNDALVELSGALVGFSLALQKSRLVAIVGLITGSAAALSMASSEYLSIKHEEGSKNPLKASIYTGFSYICAVLVLVTPYFLFKDILFPLGLVIVDMLLLIFFFTYYLSLAKGYKFKERFVEMAGLSLGIALINFAIGLIIRLVFGIN